MGNWVLWVTITVYILVLVGVAFITGRSSKSIADLTVGGRRAGAWLSALSYGTAYFSAVMFVGYAGSTGYSFGLWGVLAGLGNMVFGSLVAWLLLARRSQTVAQEQGIKTMPEYFEKRYGSKAMRLFSCLVIFLFFIPYSASVYKGLGSVSQVLLGINATVFMVIIAVVAALLLLFGGYLAQARADFVQGIIMFFGVLLLILFVVRSKAVGGLEGLSAYAHSAEGLPKLGAKQWWGLLSLVLMTSFGTWGLPHMVQKFFGIKTREQAKRGISISTIFALVVAGGGYFIGSLCHAFFTKANYDQFQADYGKGFKDYIVPHMLEQANIPQVMLGIVIVLLLAASISTLCSVTLTASSVLVLDFWKQVKPGKSNSEKPWTIGVKVTCLIFVLISYFVANTNTPIIDMMSYSWGIISGSFLAPYLIGLYNKRARKEAAWAAIGVGFCIAVVPAFCKVLTMFGSTLETVVNLSNQGPQFATVAMAVSVVVCSLANVFLNVGKSRKVQLG